MSKKTTPRTKSEVLAYVAEETGLTRKEVAGVLTSMNGMIEKSLKRNGVFAIPGLVKLKVVRKPATKARQGVNPFTGETMMFNAKPASNKVNALALKNLKDMVA
jgi:Bacterial nucleoid DNA-binding protein